MQVSVRFRCDAVPMRLARVSNPFSGLRADSVLWRRLAGVGRQLVCVAAECAQLVGACCSDLLVRASLRAAHVSWCATDRAAYATVERGRLPTLGVMARLCLLSRTRSVACLRSLACSRLLVAHLCTAAWLLLLVGVDDPWFADAWFRLRAGVDSSFSGCGASTPLACRGWLSAACACRSLDGGGGGGGAPSA